MRNLITLALASVLITSCTTKPTAWEKYKSDIVSVSKTGLFATVVENIELRSKMPYKLKFADHEFRIISPDTAELSDGMRFVKNHKCNRYFPIVSDTNNTKHFYVYIPIPKDSVEF